MHIVKAAWTAVALLVLALAAACDDSTSPPYSNGGGPGAGTPVSIAFCAGSEPNWLAFQDGNGTWTRAQPTIAGSRITYQNTFNSDRGAVATARVFARGVSRVSVQYALPAELAIVGDTNPLQCGGPVPFALLGSVAGIDTTNEEAQISAGLELRTTAPHGADNTFALLGLSPGRRRFSPGVSRDSIRRPSSSRGSFCDASAISRTARRSPSSISTPPSRSRLPLAT